MKAFINFLLIFLFISELTLSSQAITIKSPDNKIVATINNGEKLTYSVTFRDRNIINTSPLGFEFRNEPLLTGNFSVLEKSIKKFNETWIPVVKSKHAEITE